MSQRARYNCTRRKKKRWGDKDRDIKEGGKKVEGILRWR